MKKPTNNNVVEGEKAAAPVKTKITKTDNTKNGYLAARRKNRRLTAKK